LIIQILAASELKELGSRVDELQTSAAAQKEVLHEEIAKLKVGQDIHEEKFSKVNRVADLVLQHTSVIQAVLQQIDVLSKDVSAQRASMQQQLDIIRTVVEAVTMSKAASGMSKKQVTYQGDDDDDEKQDS